MKENFVKIIYENDTFNRDLISDHDEYSNIMDKYDKIKISLDRDKIISEYVNRFARDINIITSESYKITIKDCNFKFSAHKALFTIIKDIGKYNVEEYLKCNPKIILQIHNKDINTNISLNFNDLLKVKSDNNNVNLADGDYECYLLLGIPNICRNDFYNTTISRFISEFDTQIYNVLPKFLIADRTPFGLNVGEKNKSVLEKYLKHKYLLMCKA